MPGDLLEDRRGYQRASRQHGEPAAKLPQRGEAAPITGSAVWNLPWTTSTPWKLSAARPSPTSAKIGWRCFDRPKSRWAASAGRSKPMHASLATSPIVALLRELNEFVYRPLKAKRAALQGPNEPPKPRTGASQ